MSQPATPSGRPFLEYGGLASVPGPFRCSDATIVMIPLEADPSKLAALCTTVLDDPTGTASYTPVGTFVMLSFGTMTVRSECPGRSPLYNIAYAEMGASTERHVAIWIPVIAGHRDGSVDLIDKFAMFLPAMWVDNPVSLVGGRDIYGIAKQWGIPTVGDDRRSCTLDVFGGHFGREEVTEMRRLIDITPRSGTHPVEALEAAAKEAERIVGQGIKKLVHGEIEMPDGALLAEAVDAVRRRVFRQVAVRQHRTPHGDGAEGSDPRLIDITTKFHKMTSTPIGHGFDVKIHRLGSHPLERTLGIVTQEAPLGMEVTAEFTLAAE